MSKKLVNPCMALFLLVLWCTDTQRLFPCFFIAAAVHEGGHLFAMLAFGARRIRLSFCGAGLELSYFSAFSYKEDALTALAGPAAGFLFWFLVSALTAHGVFPPRGRLYAGASLMLSLFNLLPAYPLDGAQALYALLSLKLPPQDTERILYGTTLFIASLMFAAGLYIFIKTRYNISMLACSGLMIGGLYAKGSGKSPAKGTKTRALRRRRGRADQKGFKEY